MTVLELKKLLEQYPDDMEVFVDERISEFNYGLLNSVQSKEIDFVEDPEGEPLAQKEVVILSEV